MSTCLGLRLHRTKKRRCCVWCGKTVEVGDMYFKQVWVDGGDFGQQAWHTWCYDHSKTEPYDEDWEPYCNPSPVATPELDDLLEEEKVWDDPYPEENNFDELFTDEH